jgi:hypothetical protein
MHKILEELARVIGRAWARRWLESRRDEDAVDRQLDRSKEHARDSSSKDQAVCAEHEFPNESL